MDFKAGKSIAVDNKDWKHNQCSSGVIKKCIVVEMQKQWMRSQKPYTVLETDWQSITILKHL